MARKATAKKSRPSVRKDHSFVDKIVWFIATKRETETQVGLIMGAIFGALCPVVSYYIFHYSIAGKTGWEKAGLILAGLAGCVISIINIYKLMLELTKNKLQAASYAVLFEVAAMLLHGTQVANALSLMILSVIIFANWVKMAHEAQIRTKV